jgi:hypothetical protein
MFDFISIIFNLSHVTNTRVFSTFGEEGPIGKLNFIVMNKKNMIVGLEQILCRNSPSILSSYMWQKSSSAFQQASSRSLCSQQASSRFLYFLAGFLGLMMIILIQQKFLGKIWLNFRFLLNFSAQGKVIGFQI